MKKKFLCIMMIMVMAVGIFALTGCGGSDDSADKDKLVCANEQYYLLWEGTHTSWEKADAEAFIDAAIKMWNEW